MAGLPIPLTIAIWLVAAMWTAGPAAYYVGFSSHFIWLLLFLGSGAALAEWRALRNRVDE
jgi:hypothetical protein